MSKQNISIIVIVLLIMIISFIALNGADNKNNNANDNQTSNQINQTVSKEKQTRPIVKEISFEGEKGETLKLEEEKIIIDAEIIEDGLAHFYNTELSNGKKVYFFALKDANGVYRAAANACQVCHKSKLGFVQEGNYMKCKTCGNIYPMEKIATEKGGCNPGPINPNLKVENGTITINQSELEEIADLF